MVIPLARSSAVVALAATLLGNPLAAHAARIEKLESPSALVPLSMHTGGRMLSVATDNGQRTFQRFQWPGIYFTTAFRGPEVVFSTGQGDAILHILIDDQPALPLVKPGAGLFRVAGLAEGVHTIRIEFVTENQSAPVDFGSFFLSKGQPAEIPSPALRQIEFIGDSHTVGYGNTSTTRQCTPGEVWATTDNSQSFAVLTAKNYRAEYRINAISGRGIVRNYNGGAADSLPAVYPYVLFDKQAAATDAGWKPQIIIVALGTNDFSTPLHDGEKWKSREELHADFEQSYVKFIRQLRVVNPGAFFILAANDGAEGEIQAEVRKVIDRLHAAGETRVTYVPFGHLELTGCDWHPSRKDHAMMAAALKQLIDSQPDIWPDGRRSRIVLGPGVMEDYK